MKVPVFFNKKGAAAVEFALCLPLLLLILFAIIEFGWYFTNQIVLANAVSAGARAGVKAKEWEGESPAVFARRATRDAFWISDIPGIHVEIIEPSQTSPREIKVRVTSLEYSSITGFLPPDLIPEFVKAKAIMAFP